MSFARKPGAPQAVLGAFNMSEYAVGPRGERLNGTLGNLSLAIGEERSKVAFASWADDDTLAEFGVLDALAGFKL